MRCVRNKDSSPASSVGRLSPAQTRSTRSFCPPSTPVRLARASQPRSYPHLTSHPSYSGTMSTSQRYQAHSPDAVAPPSASAGPSTARRPSSVAMDEDDATDEERPSATPASARGRRRSSASTRPRKPSISAGGAAANDGSTSASVPVPGSVASAQAVKASRGPNSQVNYKIKFHKSRDRYHKVLEVRTICPWTSQVSGPFPFADHRLLRPYSKTRSSPRGTVRPRQKNASWMKSSTGSWTRLRRRGRSCSLQRGPQRRQKPAQWAMLCRIEESEAVTGS